MDVEKEKALTWIAREALKAPLPEYWKICYTEDREVYYFNMRTGESIWDHPMDAYYKSLFKQEKAKLEKKRKKMRLFSGSMSILPLQTFFSEHHLDGDLPDALCDPIDFMLLVDPVVLPTSGRTVSKHTIVNNKWRDPFSREYVENRRLIYNVDKRHEVDQWLRKELVKYFKENVLFPEQDANQQSGEFGVSSASKDAVGAGSATPDEIQARFKELMRILPFLLDKEDEVCLEGQRLCLNWFTHAYSLGKRDQRKRRGSHRNVPGPRDKDGHKEKSAVRSVATPPAGVTPHNPASSSEIYTILRDHDTPGDVLAPFLTMSTSASLECLALILTHHPNLRTHPCFFAYNADVLSVLQLTESDLTSLAKSLAAGSANPFAKTTNTDFMVKLRWCYLVMDTVYEVNVLTPLPWQHSFPLLITAHHSLPPSPALPSLTIKMVRELSGWPENVKHCDQPTVKWLVSLALAAGGDLTQQLLLLYDLLINAGDTVIPMCKKQKQCVLSLMESFGATFPDEHSAVALHEDGLGTAVQYSSMLGSFVVYHDVCRLEDFAGNVVMQLAIANALLPRLTRMQWKPKIFEATMNTITQLMESHPETAWATFKADRLDFVLKELTKKKKSNEELRARLERIEATEKRLQQSNSINNWLMLSTKLARRGPTSHRTLLDKAMHRRREIAAERCGNLVALLNVLLSVRLKIKSRDHHRAERPDVAPRRKLSESAREAHAPPEKARDRDDKTLTLPPI
eukprot:TRINITY_DN16915_c0_g1_i1.p1 TRINITY_DN16915_c0_g1~~TRINITY_DN16915_c0_g1_i1.p1  ORF type:complete len:741 (+),score=269.86 TRINITY_DN16915_c0_g1_i1:295-2517(+)